jgi:transcriptional regulator with XRE-family HTH domain
MEKVNKQNVLELIGENIRTLRKDNKIEIKQIASQLNITPQAFSNIENGKTDISVSKIIELANILKTSYSAILNISKNPTFNYYAENNSGGIQVQNQEFKELHTNDITMLNLLQQKLEFLQKQNELLLSKVKKS